MVGPRTEHNTRLLRSRTGFDPGGATTGIPSAGIVSDYAAGRRVYSGISRFFRPCIPELLHSRFASPIQLHDTIYNDMHIRAKEEINGRVITSVMNLENEKFNHKNKVPIRTASDHGLSIVKAAACARRKLSDSTNIQAIDRLENVLNSGAPVTVVWHKLCYAHFTNKSKIERLQATCIFCQISDSKQRLSSVMRKEMSDRILLASHLDYNVAIRLAGVIDLIAVEAKHHLNSLRRFTRSTSKTKQVSSNTDIALIWLCKELHQAADKERKIMLIPTKYQPPVVLQMKDNTTEDTAEVLRLPKYESEYNVIIYLIHVALRIRGVSLRALVNKGGGGQCTPKYVGLASTLHQATQSKDFVTLFNWAGYCLSCEQVLQLDPSLAESTLKTLDQTTGAVIPPNIVMNKFIHCTCDNIDILDETLDRKNTFHGTQMAAFQRGLTTDAALQVLQPSTRCSLIVTNVLGELHPASITPNTCEPVFNEPVDITWFNEEDNDCSKLVEATYLAFFLSRQDSETRPSWTEHIVITVDETLYCRLVELKWSVPEYQEKLIPCLGGLHISMHFIKAIGQHTGGSGLAEVWLKSGLLGQGAVERVLAGNAYNKIMRAHKLTLQALQRILVPKFPLYIAEADNEYHTKLFALVNDETPKRIPELVSLLMQERVRKLLADFIESKSEDVNFIFWWQYMDMVSILLRFTRASTTQYDHLNYARWSAIYVTDMHQLPDAVASEFRKGNFVVMGYSQTFYQIDPDQAMDWINGTGKKGGGIIDITKTTSALCRWTLSYNLRSHIAASTHAMFNLRLGNTYLNNKATKYRHKCDNDSESALVSTFQCFNDSLLHAKQLGKEEIIDFVQKRLIILMLNDKPHVSFRAVLKRNKAQTFAALYEVGDDTKDKGKKTILKAARNVL
ncbi:hypothetical protein PR048_012332 [Dryococelus australis]|uniref:Uncharacterized protein n=1 Tax=Dryococelus australis TaxID=614101 RepID=A0ABQ9HP27_9NEOP|nr:hypothetical protein PR048_012332 [Dryococelus australis]